MDVDVFPNSLEYWGPTGMLFFRNVAGVLRRRSTNGTSNARVAIEAPGASGDAGVLADRVELQNIKARFPVPDFTGHYRTRPTSGATSQVAGVAALHQLGRSDSQRRRST